MKKIILLFSTVLISAIVLAQSPEKLSYQAVIRDADGQLIINQEIGMQISILQGSIFGASVYVETQNATTNSNGLVSIEIGSEEASVVYGSFSGIDWSTGTYIIKTQTDPDGGTDYSITGTSQLLSVPYALYAKTAETVTGGVSETDPLFSESSASEITASDITKLSNLSGVNTGDQDLSLLATIAAIQDTAAAIRADFNSVSDSTGSETDPVYTASEAANITATHITNLNNLSGINTGDQDLSLYVKKTEVLKLNNTTAFTPDADYEPATKKYVDDKVDSTYSIGDFAFGGIVFWVDATGKHGLVCAKDDQTSVRWDGGSNGNTRALGDGPYAGSGNTFIIIATTAVFGDDGSTYAARVCNELQITEGSFSYGDWYLPSQNELELMYQSKDAINTTAGNNSGSAFASTSYWSSTEVSFSAAQTIEFTGGTSSAQSKANTNGVRAVRAF